MAEKVYKACQGCGHEYLTYDYYDAKTECERCDDTVEAIDSMVEAQRGDG